MKLTLLACLLFTTIFYGQCPPGDVTLSTQADVENFIATYPTCDTITGYLNITGSVNDLSALDYLLYIEGALNINNSSLTTISNFNSLIESPVGIQISNNTVLTELNGFNGLNITMQIYIDNNISLHTIDGFNNLPSVDIDFWITTNPSLQTINGFSNLTNVSYFLAINDCPLLSTIPSFNNLSFVGQAIQFYNTGLTDLSGFDNLSTIGDFEPLDGLNFSSNQNLVSVSGFNCLETIVFDVLIQDNPLLDNISGLCSLESVGQFLTIRNNNALTTLNGLQSLASLSTISYDGTVTLSIHDNPQLSNCDALCNLLSSGGLMGLANITNNQTGCDAESQINTTSCVPFDVLDCTNLISPADGATGIAIDTDISWNPIIDATSYVISIGTTSGGTQIANNLNIGNVTMYNLPSNLPANTEIFVKVKPYNTSGNAKCCDEESFITIDATSLGCTTLSSPINAATDVLLTSAISWNSITEATGYFISIGTIPGGSDILNSFDVGNVTTYNPTTNLPNNTQLFVTITPYNASGLASGCTEASFTTEDILNPPSCTNVLNPSNGETAVSIATALTWSVASNATGYLLSIGTTSGGTDILDNQDVGAVLTYTPINNLPNNTQLFVTIIPYNASGLASGCTEASFTTEDILNPPSCTNLLNPSNGATAVSIATDLTWNAASNATGYLLSIGTTSGGTDILNNQDVGAVLTYTPINNLPNDTQLFVTITPYNTSGLASGCTEASFTTEDILNPPSCTSLLNPSNGATAVSIATDLTWSVASNATGYLLSIGTTPGGTDILDNQDVGNDTNISLPFNFPEQTEIHVLITPYNSNGEALNCLEQRFTTELNTSLIIPLYFTPNNDLIHDEWHIKDPEHKIKELSIFDRFGKLLKSINGNPFKWDGTYNNQLLPQSDYWYQIQLYSGEKFTGHFTLRR